MTLLNHDAARKEADEQERAEQQLAEARREMDAAVEDMKWNPRGGTRRRADIKIRLYDKALVEYRRVIPAEQMRKEVDK